MPLAISTGWQKLTQLAMRDALVTCQFNVLEDDLICTWDHQPAVHLEAVQGLLLHQRLASLLAGQSAQQLVAPACLEVPRCS